MTRPWGKGRAKAGPGEEGQKNSPITRQERRRCLPLLIPFTFITIPITITIPTTIRSGNLLLGGLEARADERTGAVCAGVFDGGDGGAVGNVLLVGWGEEEEEEEGGEWGWVHDGSGSCFVFVFVFVLLWFGVSLGDLVWVGFVFLGFWGFPDDEWMDE